MTDQELFAYTQERGKVLNEATRANKYQTRDAEGPADVLLRDAIQHFGRDMYNKALLARDKYGFHPMGWACPDWQEEMQRQMAEHVLKGDPRDTGWLSTIAWYHGWKTATPSLSLVGEVPAETVEAVADNYVHINESLPSTNRPVEVANSTKTHRQWATCEFSAYGTGKRIWSNAGGGIFFDIAYWREPNSEKPAALLPQYKQEGGGALSQPVYAPGGVEVSVEEMLKKIEGALIISYKKQGDEAYNHLYSSTSYAVQVLRKQLAPAGLALSTPVATAAPAATSVSGGADESDWSELEKVAKDAELAFGAKPADNETSPKGTPTIMWAYYKATSPTKVLSLLAENARLRIALVAAPASVTSPVEPPAAPTQVAIEGSGSHE